MNMSLPPTVPLHYVSLALSLCLSRPLSLSFSLSSIVLCSLVEPNTCVRLPHVHLGSSQVDRRMLHPESAMLQRLGSHVSQRTATEHSPARSRGLDPDIRLQKANTPTDVRLKKHHDRKPDVGIGIRIFVPNDDSEEMTEYYGEYLGHGQSKTAFELHGPGAPFHGQVLKVAKAHDMEPSVFREAAQASLTTSVLYNCDGVDAASGKRYHCWITDRTIPLDDFCRNNDAIKSRCSLAAF